MNNRTYDCAIIGGGLAGLSLSILLANLGHTVILFEKENYPFHRVCGEYISMESCDFLERIGIPINEMDLPKINEVKITSPNGKSLTRPLKLGGFGISRYCLDFKLAQLAKSKGVVIMENTKVLQLDFINNQFIINTSNGLCQADMACGAYGKHSNLDKTKKQISKNYFGVKYHIQGDYNHNRIELHNFKNGYCGISKIENDKYCLCYLSDSQNLRDYGNQIKLMETNLLMKNPYLKYYFEHSTFLFDKPLTISQITFDTKKAIQDHILCIGDAAGTIAPLCGNGMSMAMHSAFIASGIIQQFLINKSLQARINMEKRYEMIWKQQFRIRIKSGKLIQNLFGKDMITNSAISFLNKTPFIADQLIKLTHGSKF